MSNESTSLIPHSLAISVAKIAPPAGPDSTKRTGNLIAVSSVVNPPPDVISKNGQLNPSLVSWLSNSLRYLDIMGCT